MTISAADLWFYAIAMVVVALTPGPVWVATIARALSGGFAQAWPLTLGVALGDVLWSVLAVLGVGWIVGNVAGALEVFRYVAAGLFVFLGISVLRHAGNPIRKDSRLTRRGVWAGFAAGVVVILSNPKAVLFYMGFLPGFFDLTSLSAWDVAAIATLSFVVPLSGNLALALVVARARGALSSPTAMKRVNQVAGGALICVGLVIPVM